MLLIKEKNNYNICFFQRERLEMLEMKHQTLWELIALTN